MHKGGVLNALQISLAAPSKTGDSGVFERMLKRQPFKILQWEKEECYIIRRWNAHKFIHGTLYATEAKKE